MLRIGWRIAGCLLVVVISSRQSQAQVINSGFGYQGDLFRGQGAFLQGAGEYLFAEARANAINVETAIRLNEYLWNVAKFENYANAVHRAKRIARQNENYYLILKRLRETPDDHDLERGDTLNDIMSLLLDPANPPSVFRESPVHLPGETIRGIPFFYAPEDATFSMRRLAAKKSWPVGLRGEKFANERRAYERAFDHALDQQIDGKLSREAIAEVEKSLDALVDQLPRIIPPSNDKVYIESRDFLKRLKDAKELLKRQKIEEMLGRIDKYSGTDLYDLLLFMQSYNLRFGTPELGFERDQYPKLYAAMKLQLDLIKTRQAPPPVQ